jgi:hypothetical protein
VNYYDVAHGTLYKDEHGTYIAIRFFEGDKEVVRYFKLMDEDGAVVGPLSMPGTHTEGEKDSITSRATLLNLPEILKKAYEK